MYICSVWWNEGCYRHLRLALGSKIVADPWSNTFHFQDTPKCHIIVTWHHRMGGKFASQRKANFDIILFLAKLALKMIPKMPELPFSKMEINLIMSVRIFLFTLFLNCIKVPVFQYQ